MARMSQEKRYILSKAEMYDVIQAAIKQKCQKRLPLCHHEKRLGEVFQMPPGGSYLWLRVVLTPKNLANYVEWTFNADNTPIFGGHCPTNWQSKLGQDKTKEAEVAEIDCIVYCVIGLAKHMAAC